MERNWEETAGKLERCLSGWESRFLPTLRQRVLVLQIFALPIVWYKAHLLPASLGVVGRMEKAVKRFLWRGSLERVSFETVKLGRSQGGLGLTDLASKMAALRTRTVLRILARSPDDKYRRIFAYWMGLKLRVVLPDLARPPNVEALAPPYFEELKDLVLSLVPSVVPAASLGSLTTKVICGLWGAVDFHPRVEVLPLEALPGGWVGVWGRLVHEVLDFGPADVLF